MNDGQVKQIVSAIREHTRAMVVMKYRAFFNDAPISKVIGIADALLAALSASSGGEHSGAGIPGGGKPEHAAGPGDELTATPPLSADLVTARARIADLEEAARRYFNADGSVSFLVSAEAVVEARKAAARRIAELEAQVRERDGLLRQVLDPDDCRLDHHGFCQTQDFKWWLVEASTETDAFKVIAACEEAAKAVREAGGVSYDPTSTRWAFGRVLAHGGKR